jgi:hypothetical protein
MKTETILFIPDGTARCLWTEAVPLQELGRLTLQRASTVEFNHPAQVWEVRLASDPGAVAFAHPSRETCLNWERNTLNARLDLGLDRVLQNPVRQGERTST